MRYVKMILSEVRRHNVKHLYKKFNNIVKSKIFMQIALRLEGFLTKRLSDTAKNRNKEFHCLRCGA